MERHHIGLSRDRPVALSWLHSVLCWPASFSRCFKCRQATCRNASPRHAHLIYPADQGPPHVTNLSVIPLVNSVNTIGPLALVAALPPPGYAFERDCPFPRCIPISSLPRHPVDPRPGFNSEDYDISKSITRPPPAIFWRSRKCHNGRSIVYRSCCCIDAKYAKCKNYSSSLELAKSIFCSTPLQVMPTTCIWR